jgi:hypothetical protein
MTITPPIASHSLGLQSNRSRGPCASLLPSQITLRAVNPIDFANHLSYSSQRKSLIGPSISHTIRHSSQRKSVFAPSIQSISHFMTSTPPTEGRSSSHQSNRSHRSFLYSSHRRSLFGPSIQSISFTMSSIPPIASRSWFHRSDRSR